MAAIVKKETFRGSNPLQFVSDLLEDLLEQVPAKPDAKQARFARRLNMALLALEKVYGAAFDACNEADNLEFDFEDEIDAAIEAALQAIHKKLDGRIKKMVAAADKVDTLAGFSTARAVPKGRARRKGRAGGGR